MKVRLETFAGDDDRLGVEALPDQEPAPAPVHSVRKPTGPASSDSLVRAFPQFPEGVRHFCKPLGHSDANVRTCQGFDAVVSYDVAPDEKPRSLTVLDPPGAKTEEECRGVLIKDRSDLMVQPEGPSHAERKVSYFTSAGVDGQSVWLEAKGFRKSPSCSVMVCDKGPAGGRTPCAP